jgi:hypothetical protein
MSALEEKKRRERRERSKETHDNGEATVPLTSLVVLTLVSMLLVTEFKSTTGVSICDVWFRSAYWGQHPRTVSVLNLTVFSDDQF